MIPNKYITLMNQEIDTVNSPDESRELERFLGENPDGRRYFNELKATASIFEKVDDIDPPAFLQDSIMAAIDQTAAQQAHGSSADEQPSRPGWLANLAGLFRIRPQFAYSFVAGVLVGICVLSLYTSRQASHQGDAENDFYATIIPADAEVFGPASPLIEVAGPGVSGTARALFENNLILVRVSLQSDETVEIVFGLSDRIRCQGYRTTASGGFDLTVGDDQARLHHTGSGDFELVFTSDQSDPQPLHMQILADGTVLCEHQLVQ